MTKLLADPEGNLLDGRDTQYVDFRNGGATHPRAYSVILTVDTGA
jgi:hypothetical protein